MVKAPTIDETQMDVPLLDRDGLDNNDYLSLEFRSLTAPSDYQNPLEKLKKQQELDKAKDLIGKGEYIVKVDIDTQKDLKGTLNKKPKLGKHFGQTKWGEDMTEPGKNEETSALKEEEPEPEEVNKVEKNE